MAPEPRCVVDATPAVEHRMFILCDSVGGDLSPLDDMPEDMNPLLYPGPEAVILGSAGDTFYPEVRLEVWDTEPPAPHRDAWDQIEDAEFRAPSGRVRLRSPEGARAAEVEAPGERVRVRAACRGRNAVDEAVCSGAFDFYGIESWLIQLWPG